MNPGNPGLHRNLEKLSTNRKKPAELQQASLWLRHYFNSTTFFIECSVCVVNLTK